MSDKKPMKNCTINIPEIYDKNIQKLVKLKIVPSRSECIRTALREFIEKEYGNLVLLGYFEDSQEGDISSWSKTKSTIKTTHGSEK